MRQLFSIVLGITVGAISIGLIEFIGHYFYPTGLTTESSAEDLQNYVDQAPILALLFIPTAYFLGTFAGCFVGTKIVKDEKRKAIYVTAGTLFLFGVVNAFQIPHPIWLLFLMLISFVGATFLALKKLA